MSDSSNGGIGLGGALLLIFITLKLMGYIEWSWLWVLSPLWIVAALVATILLIVGIVSWIIHFRDKRRLERRLNRDLKRR